MKQGNTDQKKIGKNVGNVEILDIKNFAAVVKRDKIEVAVIATPFVFLSTERVNQLKPKAKSWRK